MLTLCLVGVLASLVACECARRWWAGRRTRRLVAHLPQLPALPFLGHLHLLLGDAENALKLLDQYSELAENTGSMVKAWLGSQLLCLVVKPADIRAINNAFLEKPSAYQFAKHWVGGSIVMVKADVWKRSVKFIAPTVSTRVLDGFMGVFNEQGRVLARRLRENSGKKNFDPSLDINTALLKAICQTAFGYDMTEEDISLYMKNFEDLLGMLMKRALNPFLYPDIIYDLTSDFRSHINMIKNMRNVVDKVMKKSKQEFVESEKNDETSAAVHKEKYSSFVDVLLKYSAGNYTEEYVLKETQLMIAAGFMTSAAALIFIVHALGSYPKIQEKLFNEISKVLEDSDNDINNDDLERMPYCEAVVKETLRLYPTGPLIMRKADRDLKLDGYTVPAGAICLTSLWGCGRSRSQWGPDALTFRPERWLEDPAPDPAAFAPFSIGRRTCIGPQYALAILKVSVIHMVRAVHFSGADIQKARVCLELALHYMEPGLTIKSRDVPDMNKSASGPFQRARSTK